MISLFRSLNKEFKPKKMIVFLNIMVVIMYLYYYNCHINDFLKQYGDFSAKNFRTMDRK